MDKAVVKALGLLEILSHSDAPLGVTEISKRSELGKSNVHRLLQTLQGLGYVRQTSGTGYEATLKTWELGSSVISRLNIRDLARESMQVLSGATGETVHLSELHGSEVLYIEKIESREPVRAYTQLGGRAPAHCTATGKVMLAYATDDMVKECLSDAQTFTAKTIIKARAFADEIVFIRRNRFALNEGEWREDVIGAAAPICDNTGRVCAAIGLSAPASRLTVDRLRGYAPMLIDHAERVSRGLGCSSAQWQGL